MRDDHDEPIEPSPRIVHPTIAAAPVRRASEGEDDTIAASPGAAKPSSRPAALPDRLGRYLVLERIGEGGMVVAAYDPELERKLALKVLRTDRDDEDGRARLLREAQAMAKLSHPNVVPVFDVGIVDDRVFVAMELVRVWSIGAEFEVDPRRSIPMLSPTLARDALLSPKTRSSQVDVRPIIGETAAYLSSAEVFRAST